MFTRREFLGLCGKAALTVSLAEVLLTDMNRAVMAKELKKPTVIWLELGSCTGNTISLDNSATPTIKDLFSNVIDLHYHWIFMGVEGVRALDVLHQTEKDGEFILVVEGSVMLADQGSWDLVGYENGQYITGLSKLKELGAKAKSVIAIGTCAAFGGPSSTHPNPSKSVGVQDVLDRQVINVSGCPAHPDWFVGTLYHLINYGIPELDAYNRPKLFYGRLLHDQCQRRTYFERGIFAKNLGEPWCMYTLGCRGPRTFADCPNREWNQTDNWPVGCNTPCIGCVEPGFPDIAMPFFQRYPDLNIPGVFSADMDKAALGLGIATLGALGVHMGANLITHRLRKNLTETALPLEPPSSRTLAQQQGIDDSATIKSKPKAKRKPQRLKRTLRK